jgi:hypothetical protein
LIHSDGSKRIYLEHLLSQATLNAEPLKGATRLIQEISSDGDKTRLLKEVVIRYTDDEFIRKAFIDAASSFSREWRPQAGA